MQIQSEIIGKKKNLRDAVYAVLSDPELSKDFYYKFAYIWMTRKCNSECRHCYQNGSRNGIEWSYEKADKVTDLFLNDGYIVNPIVNEWLPQYWPYLQILKKCGVKEISSNGIILLEYGDDFVNLLKQNDITDIRHTLFPENTHQYYTGRSFDDAVRAIKFARNNGFRTVLNYVVTKKTLPEIESYCLNAVNFEADEIQFLNFICSNRAKKLRNETLDADDISHFWEMYNAITRDDRFSSITFDFQANFGPNPDTSTIFHRASLNHNFCLAGIWKHGKYLYITPEDDVFPCATLLEPDFKIGKIIEKAGTYELLLNETELESLISNFDRSQCACLQYTHDTILKDI